MSFVTKAWNKLNWRRKAAVFWCLRSFPDSDLAAATEGQLVKITGLVSCGSVSLESSYERAARCTYVSTLLYEYGGFGVKPMNANSSCLQWNLKYCERFSTDFYITDRKSEAYELEISVCFGRYVQEGSFVTVIGVLRRNNDISMIVQPQELFSTGCLWQKLLLPVDVDGLILGFPDTAGPNMNPEFAVNFLPNIAREQVACKPSCSGVRWINVRDECPPAGSPRIPPVPA
ncbi:hypothetical protein D5086_005117 [Populus alba]|uniref:Uncharacterized protein n=1 Tax=Populus alba TaxID=43335 RepID=A0ACC4CSG5_POPAL